MNKPQFSLPIRNSVTNYHTNQKAILTSIDSSFEIVESQLEDIVKICNQDGVYDWLFNVNLEGNAYTLEKAQSFADHCQKSWDEMSSFKFWLLEDKRVVAALDIKSDNLESAEVGYWADANTPGYMTNALNELCNIASAAGYRSLYTLIRPANIASRNLAERAGFDYQGYIKENDKKYCKYTRTLTS
ncbi:GNAT family N-acetyltransferase [Candidatus Dojkabacteria bacterium]|uniref:GNAT family N-acetyltransferase n=1 Tax=Candidatus Dojkabacteria bacterium TaxID=2099670 RepID=A0A955RIE5_9BACT|nr:GNAT family N-acetyltransferase [Candidatus Dojkabacteria bacterium]